MSDYEFGSDGQAVDEVTAAERIRAFEDAHLPNTVRIAGQIETGHGSRFKMLPIGHQRHYAALERLAEAESHLASANSALAEAQAAHAAAKAQADDSEVAVDEPEPAAAAERSESEQGSG